MEIEVKIRLVTDKEELKRVGCDAPVVELYTDFIDTWVSVNSLSFNALKEEIMHIKRATEHAEKVKQERKKLK